MPLRAPVNPPDSSSGAIPRRRILPRQPRLTQAQGRTTGIENWRLTVGALSAIPLIVYCMVFPLTRVVSEGLLFVALAGAMGSVLMYGRLVMPLAQILFAILATVWLLLSMTDMLPPAWTIFYDNGAAVRQWSYVLIIPIITTSFYVFLQKYGAFIWRHAFLLAIAWYILSRIALVISQEREWQRDILLYGVNNINFPLFVLLYIFALSRKRPIFVDLAIILAIAVVCPTVTNLAAALCAGGLRVFNKMRFAPLIIGVMLIAVLLIAKEFPLEVYQLDANSGVRAVMWRDATAAVIQTNGLGVGFGTEYISNQFNSIARDWVLLDQRDPTRMFVSTHSAFYDAALRMGLGGLVLFLAWIGRYSIVDRKVTGTNVPLSAALAILMYLSLALNPAMVSTNIYIGVSAVLATLEYLRTGANPSGEKPEPHRLVPRRIPGKFPRWKGPIRR